MDIVVCISYERIERAHLRPVLTLGTGSSFIIDKNNTTGGSPHLQGLDPLVTRQFPCDCELLGSNWYSSRNKIEKQQILDKLICQWVTEGRERGLLSVHRQSPSLSKQAVIHVKLGLSSWLATPQAYS